MPRRCERMDGEWIRDRPLGLDYRPRASQQRSMQNWIDLSVPPAAESIAARHVCPGGGCAVVIDTAVKDRGNSSQPHGTDTWGQLTGRSRVIHELRNGFLSAGREP